MSGNWTHPICDGCWEIQQPDQIPFRLKSEWRESEVCCWCGRITESGIYLREDPAVPTNHQDHPDPD